MKILPILLLAVSVVAQDKPPVKPKITDTEVQLELARLENRMLNSAQLIAQQQAIQQSVLAALKAKQDELCGPAASLAKEDSGRYYCKNNPTPEKKGDATEPKH